MKKRYDPNLIREVGYGNDQREGEQPAEEINTNGLGVKEVVETAGHKVYVNRKAGEVYVETTEYHAGTLVISKAGLEKLLAEFSK